MKFDPSKYEEKPRVPQGNGEPKQYKQLGPGKKTLHGITAERWTAKSGTPMLKVWFVVVKDHTTNGDEGQVCSCNFAVTDKAIFRWARFCRAIKWDKAHDLNNDGDVENVVGSGPVDAMLVPNEWNGKTTYQPDEFMVCEGEFDPAWDALIERGTQSVERIRAKSAQYRSEPSSGGYSASTASAPAVDDDIPF
jgi:hypothetical protein